jgi:hypothetical protein
MQRVHRPGHYINGTVITSIETKIVQEHTRQLVRSRSGANLIIFRLGQQFDASMLLNFFVSPAESIHDIFGNQIQDQKPKERR